MILYSMSDWLTQLDVNLFFVINRELQNRFFDLIMPVITNRSYLIILPFVVFFLIKGRKQALIIVALSVLAFILADGAGNTLKHLIGRERPCNILENVHLLAGCSKSPSMPSNHASNSVAFAVSFLLLAGLRLKSLEGISKRLSSLLAAFFLFVAALVCYSRVSLGVHYPSDVLAGAIVGSFSALSVVALYIWAERRYEDQPQTTVLFVFLLGLSIFRIYYILHGPLDLSPDEAHYWEWSRRPDLSYYSKGPMIAYLIGLGTFFFGDTVLGVRFLAVIFSALTSILLYRLGREMYGDAAGTASAILFQLIPLYSAFGLLFTIDSPFLFFWTLSLYLFWKTIHLLPGAGTEGEAQREIDNASPGMERGSILSWILLGVSMGLGLLTKYTMAFFPLCAFLYLIASKKGRALLGTIRPYLALLIGLVIFSPVIVWNAQHQWVTIRHTAGQAHIHDGLQFSAASFFDFVGSQLGVVTPILLVLVVISLWKVAGGEKKRFLLWFSVPVLLFFTLKSIQGKVQANWAMTGYITCLIAFSAVFIVPWKEKRFSVKALVIAATSLSLTVTAVAHYPAMLHLPLKLDPSARLRGWKDLGRDVSQIYTDALKKGGAFIFTDSYQDSSELAFYVKGHPVTYCMNSGRRMNQYDLWPGFDRLIHYQGIFVTIGGAALTPQVKDAFLDCEERPVKVFDRGRLLREYSVFVCSNFQGMKEPAIGSY
ncbi:MAG TPA: glycosyltransferase family 39 protein [Thermodesulfovibrionales bacterium]|nr:glycosyltransferase family 39 protein [Thermodesulfovibrionales bacterium]